MRTALLVIASSLTLISPVAHAQDISTSFRGIRIEGNAGGDRFQSQGVHNDKFGYGGTVGFDGVIGDKIVIGPEGSYWRANDWSENCTGSIARGSLCHKSFEEWGAAVRVGYLVSPRFLVFGKGGYVNNEQRKRFDAPAGQASFYDHFRTDGYQVGGGVEYTVSDTALPVPVYVNAQYVYSQYHDHTSRQRVMGGIGIRFK
jgi:outer membrane immunogenic protein